MSCAPIRNSLQPRRAVGGFTLVEVMLGVMIMALMMISIYRFMETDLEGIRVSTEVTAKETSSRTLMATVKGELQAIPQGTGGALLGQPHMFNKLSGDEMTWLSEPGSGNGLFTRYSSGEYKVTLTIIPNPATKQSDLGLWRTLPDAKQKENWLPLIPDVRALEIRYYDPNVNAWVDSWTDQNNRPKMVRLRMWRGADLWPYESVVALPLRGQVSYTDGNAGGGPAAGGPRGGPGGRNGNGNGNGQGEGGQRRRDRGGEEGGQGRRPQPGQPGNPPRPRP